MVVWFLMVTFFGGVVWFPMVTWFLMVTCFGGSLVSYGHVFVVVAWFLMVVWFLLVNQLLVVV